MCVCVCACVCVCSDLNVDTCTHRLSVGTELMYQKGGGLETSLLSLGGAFKASDWEVAAKVGLHAWNVSYLHKYKGIQLATEFDGNLMQVKS